MRCSSTKAGNASNTLKGVAFKANDWSNELKAQTCELIDSGGPIGSPDGSLGLKHVDGGFGIITMLDLAWAVLRIVDRRTKAEIATFASIDDLIAAGWAID